MNPARAIGEHLKDARLRRGLSLEQVSYQTKISLGRLSQMEEGDFSSFPNITYAKSFLKIYSNYLGVDSHVFALNSPTARKKREASAPLPFVKHSLVKDSAIYRRKVSGFWGPVLILLLCSIPSIFLFLYLKKKREEKVDSPPPAQTQVVVPNPQLALFPEVAVPRFSSTLFESGSASLEHISAALDQCFEEMIVSYPESTQSLLRSIYYRGQGVVAATDALAVGGWATQWRIRHDVEGRIWFEVLVDPQLFTEPALYKISLLAEVGVHIGQSHMRIEQVGLEQFTREFREGNFRQFTAACASALRSDLNGPLTAAWVHARARQLFAQPELADLFLEQLLGSEVLSAPVDNSTASL